MRSAILVQQRGGIRPWVSAKLPDRIGGFLLGAAISQDASIGAAWPHMSKMVSVSDSSSLASYG